MSVTSYARSTRGIPQQAGRASFAQTLARLCLDVARPAPRPWHEEARPEQLPPPGDWLVWLILSGRGFGKTRSGAEWIAEQAQLSPGTEWAAIAPTWRDCRKVIFEGPSGILAALQPGELESYNASDLQIRLTNGSRIYGYSADRPDRLRGSNLSGAWVDELAAMPRVDELWDEALLPALRIGEHPRVLVTTTPRPIAILRRLLALDDGSIVVVRGSTWDNAANLSRAALEQLRRRYEGTRAGRQELEGELLDDVEGALWTRDLIESTRVAVAPLLARIVIGVDPAVTSGEDADATGIVVVGKGHDGHVYVLEDLTMRGTPRACMSAAVKAFYRWRADRIIGEVNNGGDYIEGVLRTVDDVVPYKTVRASRGKRVRAEPVAALWEQGRGHMVGGHTDLEDQMCVAAGTLVTTRRGAVPVERVVIGDEALTRAGWKPVLWAGKTGHSATVTLHTDQGLLRCTPSHPIYVVGSEFISAGRVQVGDRIPVCPESRSGNASSSTGNATTETMTATSRPAGHGAVDSSTATSGNTSAARSLTGGTSITGTMTGETTRRPTSSPSPPPSTSVNTDAPAPGPSRRRRRVTDAGSGGNAASQSAGPVQNAAPSSNRLESGQRSAVGIARHATVIAVTESGPVDVYNLTVDEQHEFYANGLLTHNCVWTQDSPESPDALDACVWAVHELTEGASAMAYLSMISAVCPACQMPSSLGATSCGSCGADLPDAVEATT